VFAHIGICCDGRGINRIPEEYISGCSGTEDQRRGGKMIRRWMLYWFVLFSALATLLWFKNAREQPDKPWSWVTIKSTIELAIIALSAFYLPVILVLYTTNWLISSLFKTPNHRALMTGLSIVCSIVFGIVATFALEILMVLGIYGIGTLSNDFLGFLEQRQSLRRYDIIVVDPAMPGS
jgi:hypothetical protein